VPGWEGALLKQKNSKKFYVGVFNAEMEDKNAL
jgi:hypothetical protein